MSWTGSDILKKLGLAADRPKAPGSAPLTLAGSAYDRDSGLIVALKSKTEFDDKGQPSDVALRYWRHLPYGTSHGQDLFRIKFSPVKGKKGQIELDQIWFQSYQVFGKDRGDNPDDPQMRKNINRVFGAISNLNAHLREKEDVSQIAKIVADSYVAEATGEDLVIRGLNAERGGFSFPLSSRFLQAAAPGIQKGPEFGDIDLDDLKTMLGFRQNSFESQKDFSGSRTVPAVDPQSGVGYIGGVKVNRTGSARFTLEMFIHPEDVPEGVDAKSIPDLARLEFERTGARSFALTDARFMGQKVSMADTRKILNLIGFVQDSNHDLANHKYPEFMNYIYKHDLADEMSPFKTPPSLEETGGEFLYGSLHGCGFEKKIEQFGDQIGIAAVLLSRGTKKDGTISTVGVAVDFPFASGGPNSNVDGAVPDYLQFLKDIHCFCITHDHYDHKGGFSFYAQKGLLKDKTIYATKRVKRMMEKDMNAMSVPRSLRPKIDIVRGEGAIPVRDEDGNVRMWVQHSEDATKHSALCTPYIVTSCYNDDHYKGSVVIYGDSRGLEDKAKKFFQQGTRLLPDQAKKHGLAVSPDKVNKDITVALHDITAIEYDGVSPEPQEVEDNLQEVFGWFSDMGIIEAPISTNNAEYTAAFNLAHKTRRHVTAVGGNAEARVANMNLFGVLPDMDLRDIRIDPLKERYKRKADRLIPKDILDEYFSLLNSDPEEGEDDEMREKRLALDHLQNIKDYIERLPPDEREHEDNVHLYMRKCLQEYGAVVFENDVNGYLMWRAVMDRQEKASLRATRTSALGREFRNDPKSLLILVTGTQGNSEEKLSTLQKLINFYSLLDADESVRPTGYKIDLDRYVAVITQPAIPGNEESQERMIMDLVRARDITVVAAFMNGFKVYNPKGHRESIVADLQARGWRHGFDAQGNIHVYDHPIHIHGHGFRQDVVQVAKTIKAQRHEAHHIPSYDAYETFRRTMRDNGLTHSEIKPDDFKFFSVDGNAKNESDVFKCVAQINPSYILVRRLLKYGQAHGGYVEWERATMLRREGQNREDGLSARIAGREDFRQTLASTDWQLVSNPSRHESLNRHRKVGPGFAERHETCAPRSRSRFSSPLDMSKALP